MANINTVTLAGRISQDVELKYVESGSCKANLSIAVNKWNSKEKKEEANFFNVEVWGKQAEFMGEYGKKGQQVFIQGRLDTSQWTDEAGNKKSRVFINAENIELGAKKKSQGTDEPLTAEQTADLFDGMVIKYDIIGDEEMPF